MQAAGVRRKVFSSSCSVYGVPDDLPLLEDMPRSPISPYGATKMMVEYMLEHSARAWGLGAVALRYFNASGAAEDATLGEDHAPETHLIPIVLQVALGQRERVEVYGNDYPTPDGSCVRDYVHVEDLAEAHRLAIEGLDQTRMEAYNVGTGGGTSVLEVVAAARKVTGRPIPVQVVERRRGDPPALFADAEKLQRRFAWQPRYRDIGAIMESAWRWHRTHPTGFRSE